MMMHFPENLRHFLEPHYVIYHRQPHLDYKKKGKPMAGSAGMQDQSRVALEDLSIKLPSLHCSEQPGR